MCEHGALGGQTGWAVAQINEATLELVWPVSLPVQRRIMRAELWVLRQAIILSEPGATFISDCAAVLRVWTVVKSGAQRRELTCGGESGNASETLVGKPTSTR